MGLYDSVRVEMRLPGSAPVRHVYQTKSLARWPEMAEYRIAETGELWKELPGIRRERDDKNFVPERVMFDGVVNFYDLDDRGRWYEYDATFQGGVCTGIEEVENTPQL